MAPPPATLEKLQSFIGKLLLIDDQASKDFLRGWRAAVAKIATKVGGLEVCIRAAEAEDVLDIDTIEPVADLMPDDEDITPVERRSGRHRTRGD